MSICCTSACVMLFAFFSPEGNVWNIWPLDQDLPVGGILCMVPPGPLCSGATSSCPGPWSHGVALTPAPVLVHGAMVWRWHELLSGSMVWRWHQLLSGSMGPWCGADTSSCPGPWSHGVAVTPAPVRVHGAMVWRWHQLQSGSLPLVPSLTSVDRDLVTLLSHSGARISTHHIAH